MPNLKYILEVDWNSDGDFVDANDDITADLVDLELLHKRALDTDHMPPAVLRIQLKNNDHKYTPSNENSPLNQRLTPGRRARLRLAYPFDTFTDDNGVSLAAHTPTIDSGFTWVENDGAWEILVNALIVPDFTIGPSVATIDFGKSDLSIGVDFNKSPGDDGGLAVRLTDAGEYFSIEVTGTTITINKVDSPSKTELASGAFTWNTGQIKTIEVILHGDDIRVYVDGLFVVAANNSFNNTATKHGVFAVGSVQNHAWDNFGGWHTVFTGTISSILPQPKHNICEITFHDQARRFSRFIAHIAASSPARTDELLSTLITHAIGDDTGVVLDTGLQVEPSLFSANMWNRTALQLTHEIQDEEDGFVYLDGLGQWHLENRGHRTSSPHTTALYNIKDTDDGSNPYLFDLEMEDPDFGIENRITMRLKHYNEGFSVAYWALREIPEFDASEKRLYLAESASFDEIVGTVGPFALTDYKANTQADGGGSDITSELTVTINETDFFGLGTMISVTFGTTAGFLTLLQARTTFAFSVTDRVHVLAEDSTSILSHGALTRQIEARWTRETVLAQATIDNRLARRKDPVTTLQATLVNGSKPSRLALVQLRLSDRVTITITAMGLADDYFVEGHLLRIQPGSNLITRQLLLRGV